MTSNRVALITGASGSIGRACALKFAQHGFAVALTGVNERALGETERLVAERGGQSIRIGGDLQDPVFWEKLVTDTMARWGRLDVLVNNAAWRTLETMRSISLDNWEKTIRICLTAPAFLAQRGAAAMESCNANGVIINISSVMAQRPGGNAPAYAASKGGLESLTYELAALYGPRKIRVVGVRVGQVDSALSRDYVSKEGTDVSTLLQASMNDHTPLQRGGDTGEVAGVCHWLTTSEASFVNGTIVTVDGGFTHNIHPYTIKEKQMPGEF